MAAPYTYTSPQTYGYSQPKPEPPSVGELFSQFGGQLQVLLQKQAELAKLEIQEEASKAAKGGAAFAATVAVGYVALILLSFAAAWGLAELIPTGLAFLCVGVLFLIVTAVLFSQGRRTLRRVRPVPQQTIATLRRDVEVAKDSVTRGIQSPRPETTFGRN
jgi:uncharacterized membrane protein YqjE